MILGFGDGEDPLVAFGTVPLDVDAHQSSEPDQSVPH
jgi:hypothetical protein